MGALPSVAIDAIVEGRHADPFAVLGLHDISGTTVVRAFVPTAETVDAIIRGGDFIAHLARRHGMTFFEGMVLRRAAYRLRAASGCDASAALTIPALSTLWPVHEGAR